MVLNMSINTKINRNTIMCKFYQLYLSSGSVSMLQIKRKTYMKNMAQHLFSCRICFPIFYRAVVIIIWSKDLIGDTCLIKRKTYCRKKLEIFLRQMEAKHWSFAFVWIPSRFSRQYSLTTSVPQLQNSFL